MGGPPHLPCCRPPISTRPAPPAHNPPQALRLQADIFRRNAEQLAAEGDEDDVALVGALLDVSECCSRVQAVIVRDCCAKECRGCRCHQGCVGAVPTHPPAVPT